MINGALLCPEFSALIVLFVLLLGEMFVKNFSEKYSARTALGGTLFVFLTLILRRNALGETFGGTFAVTPFSVFFKIFFTLTAAAAIHMSREFFQDRLRQPGEFFLILWCTLIGLFFLSSANDFLLLFISLEIVTLSFYIMAAFLKRELVSIESGLKYLIIGSLASAFMIYGISLIYVAAGATGLPAVRAYFDGHTNSLLMRLALLLIISGIGFKIASVPFHLWVADVYEGAPTPVVSFLSVGSKAAGFVIALKVLFDVFPAFGEGRVLLFSILAAMTIIYGNLGALVQTNIKRLFGYSSISHAGYLIIGLASGGIEGTRALLFYLIAYGVSNLAAFLVITVAGKETGSDRIDAYRGLVKRSPLLAGCLFLSLLSLAGIPPLAGFFGKFLVLLAAVHAGLGWLALLGALAVAVSLFYYLSLVKKMFIEEPARTEPIAVSISSRAWLIVFAAAILIIGLWQAPFLSFAQTAAASLF